jgi:hypothetical protein
VHEQLQLAFDYTIQNSEHIALDNSNNSWALDVLVKVIANSNMEKISNYLIETVKSIALTSEELNSYKSLSKKTYEFQLANSKNRITCNFRNSKSGEIVRILSSNWKGYLYSYKTNNQKNAVVKEKIIINFSTGMNSFVFPETGKTCSELTWRDSFTLSEIESFKGYKIEPSGIRSQFRNGGYIIKESEGHGLAVSLFDYKCANFEEGKKYAKDFISCGYTDWTMPGIDELHLMNSNLQKMGYGAFLNETYLSNTYSGDQSYFDINVLTGKENRYGQVNRPGIIRAIRSF